MDEQQRDHDQGSPATEPVVSPAGHEPRPTRPDDQLPRPDLSVEAVQALAADEQLPPRAVNTQPNVDHPQRLPDGNYVGEDNIRQGRVGGVQGGPNQQQGQGQGG